MSWNDIEGNGNFDDKEKIPYTKFEQGNTVIRILDGEPYSFWSHWAVKQNMGITCLGKDCPICDVVKQQKADGVEKKTYNSSKRHAMRILNKNTGRMEKARIWNITDRTVRTWLSEAVEAAAADGVTFSVPISPHTFRHSYAMHMLYAGIPLKVLQSLMGHKSISSTEVYTKVFALDVAARHRVQFAMPESDAVALMKQLNRG